MPEYPCYEKICRPVYLKVSFRVFKESGVHVHPQMETQTDSGYQGIRNYHGKSECTGLMGLPTVPAWEEY